MNFESSFNELWIASCVMGMKREEKCRNSAWLVVLMQKDWATNVIFKKYISFFHSPVWLESWNWNCVLYYLGRIITTLAMDYKAKTEIKEITNKKKKNCIELYK
jgi:hypothetical protein